MTKYYRVYLYSIKENIPYKYEVICTRVPFSNKLFKEIISDKIIYPFNPSKGLIYEHLRSGAEEVQAKEVETWLQSMNREKIAQHLEILQKVEEENLQCYEKMKIKAQQENSKSKSIKKTLKQIKQR